MQSAMSRGLDDCRVLGPTNRERAAAQTA